MCFKGNLRGSISGSVQRRFVTPGILRPSGPGYVSICPFTLRRGDLSLAFPWIRAMTVNDGSYKCPDGLVEGCFQCIPTTQIDCIVS